MIYFCNDNISLSHTKNAFVPRGYTPEHIGSLFESCTINFNVRELKSYSKNVFLKYEKSYTQKPYNYDKNPVTKIL